MSFNKYHTSEDIILMRNLLGMTQEDFAEELGVTQVTLSRWECGENDISSENLERIYSFAYNRKIPLNDIKEQFHKERETEYERILFHGAKEKIDGLINLKHSDLHNDFGRGFYMGESLRQAALFISNYSSSCVYAISFDTKGLKKKEYNVDREWLMAIAVHRGKLSGIMKESEEEKIRKNVSNADYVIAPIADNRMFQIIDTFIEGLITDEQCIHALAATNLGKQYIAISEKAIAGIKVLERIFLCNAEKESFISSRRSEVEVSENKIRAARIKYKNKGKYIDEII